MVRGSLPVHGLIHCCSQTLVRFIRVCVLQKSEMDFLYFAIPFVLPFFLRSRYIFMFEVTALSATGALQRRAVADFMNRELKRT